MVGDIKNIVVFESLINERLTGTEIYNETIVKKIDLYKKSFTHKLYSINSKNELIELLKYYDYNSTHLIGGILFHFEMHGASDYSGLILSNGELITWKELTNLFRPINIKVCNKLFITMATCHGRYLYKGIETFEKTPYSGYISANNAIYPSEIVEKFTILFDRLIENGNLVDARLLMQKTETNFYYKDTETAFEDSYKSIYDKLMNNEEYKANYIQGVKIQAKKDRQPIPDAETLELIFQRALKDSYHKHKKAFEF
ncbi:hypothetical protein [uncultured Flavobacterium sp.]|uniref:hypothetical protein n=1 Tax=uncultured Flavobacterium sp. TaxID=165435 RepID=UPI00292F4704|nr:hypothetical protein [uncultured Flavobacterium sp.]